ncbi:MAG: hypothetical protein H6735_34125 [Alphaproteobacteria bacterium]|nr:hypothetical protein [Alphaproteobacteria bacterium]
MNTTEPDRFAEAGGQPLVIHWRLTGHVFFTWEISTEAAEAALPDELEAVEIRPGVSLFSLGALRYGPAHFDKPDAPAFDEAVAAIHVAPDLSLAGPAPRYSFYATTVWSESMDFIEQDGRLLNTPCKHVPSMRHHFDPDGLGVTIVDANGPIARMRNTHPNPVFTPTEFWGQHFEDHHGPMVRGLWEWDGTRFEHMSRGEGDPGGLFPHEFWGKVDISAVGSVYRQMFAEPGAPHHERFYRVLRSGG